MPARWTGVVYQRVGGLPILHAGSFRLPPLDGDDGAQRAVRRMRPRDILIVMLEYRPSVSHFPRRALPLRLQRSDFGLARDISLRLDYLGKLPDYSGVTFRPAGPASATRSTEPWHARASVAGLGALPIYYARARDRSCRAQMDSSTRRRRGWRSGARAAPECLPAAGEPDSQRRSTRAQNVPPRATHIALTSATQQLCATIARSSRHPHIRPPADLDQQPTRRTQSLAGQK